MSPTSSIILLVQYVTNKFEEYKKAHSISNFCFLIKMGIIHSILNVLDYFLVSKQTVSTVFRQEERVYAYVRNKCIKYIT